MTLTENFKASINFPTKATLDNCVKISEEFAIGFAEWVIQLLCSHIDSLAHQLYTDNDVTQLLEIYKKEKGL
jgi:hypothetical protein